MALASLRRFFSFRSQVNLRREQAARRRAQRRHRQVFLEALEDRRVLAYGSPNAISNTTASAFLDPLGGESVASDADGDSVIVWQQDGGSTDYDIWARLVNASGAPVGDPFPVTQHANDQRYAAVAMDAVGNFVVTWASFDQVSGSSQWDIFAQRYNAAGTAQGSTFRVNSVTTSDQYYPAIAMDDLGNFVITWSSLNQVTASSGWDIYHKRYNAVGTVLDTSDKLVNATTTDWQHTSSVAMDASGDYVIAWSDFSNSADWDIRLRRFTAGGTAGSESARIEVGTSNDDLYPAVAMDADGDFAITWMTNNGSHDDIYVRRYDAAGGFVFEDQVNATSTFNQSYSAVAMDPAGNFVVAWQSDHSGNWDVYAARYSAGSSTPIATNQLNTFTTGEQSYVSVAFDDFGDFQTAWRSSSDGITFGVTARRFDADAVTTVTTLSGPTTATEGQTLHYTFTTSDPDAQTYAISAISGGVVGTVSNQTINSSTGAGSFDVRFSDGIANSTVSITLSKNGTALAAATRSVSVANVAPSISISGAASIDEGSPYTLTLGAVTDPGTDTVTSYIVNWGDGTSNTYSTAGAKSHTYQNGIGTRAITVNLVDGDGIHVNRANPLSVVVTSPLPRVQNLLVISPISENGYTTLGGIVGGPILPSVANINFESLGHGGSGVGPSFDNYSSGGYTLKGYSGAVGVGGDSQALSSMGGNTPSAYPGSAGLLNKFFAGTIQIVAEDGSPFDLLSLDLSESNRDAANANRTITLMGTKGDGSTVSKSVTTDGNFGFQTVNFTNFSDVVSVQWTGFGTQIDNVQLQTGGTSVLQLALNWGDPTVPNNNETIDLLGTLPPHVSWNPSTGVFAVLHQYFDDNPSGTSSDTYLVEVTATNDYGSASSSTSLTVNNVPPSINGVESSLSAQDALKATVTVSASDVAGTYDPLTYEFDFNNDGVYELAGTSNSASHTYSTIGAKLVRVRVGDGDGVAALSQITVQVGAAVTFTAAMQEVAEGAGQVTVELQLSGPQSLPVTIPISSSGTAGTLDISNVPASLVILAGQTLATVVLPIAGDNLDESNETLTLTMGQPTNARSGHITSQTLTIIDDDPVPTAYSAATLSANEGSGIVAATAHLSNPSSTEVRVPFTLGGSALYGGDYTLVTADPQVFVFAPGSTAATRQIRILEDTVSERTQTLLVQLSQAGIVGAQLSNTPDRPREQSITIQDNDTVRKLNFHATSYQKTESVGTFDIPVTLEGVLDQPLSVPFTISGLTLNSDYTVVSPSAMTLSFPANVEKTTTNIRLQILNDTVFEGTETATINLLPPNNLPNLTTTNKTVTVNVLDDDQPTVKFVSSTIPSESGGNLTLTAELRNSANQLITSAQDVVIGFGYGSTDTAKLTDDFKRPTVSASGILNAAGNSLTIRPGNTSATLTFEVINDAVAEFHETFTVRAGNVSGADRPTSLQSTFAIKNDDAPRVTFAKNYSDALESIGTHSVTVNLSHPTVHEVAIPFTVAAAGATSAADYQVITQSRLKIPAGETEKAIQIKITQDSLDEQLSERISIQLGKPDHAYIQDVKNPPAHVVYIGDDDSTTVRFGVIETTGSDPVASTGKSISEGKKLNVYAYIDKPTDVDVKVPLSFKGSTALAAPNRSGSPRDYTISTIEIVIPQGDRFARAQVIVDDDTQQEEAQTIVISMGAVTGASQSTIFNTFTITIPKNDQPVPPKKETNPTYTNGCPDVFGGTVATNPCGVGGGPGDLEDIPPELLASSSSSKPTYVVGQVAAGYIEGGTVFLDANRNGTRDFLDLNDDGLQDADEPVEPFALTGANGAFFMEVPAEFDLNADGDLSAEDGWFVISSGLDTSTQLPLPISFMAPAGSRALTPLSTIAALLADQESITATEAADRVRFALDLPEVDVLNYDWIAATEAGDPFGPAFFNAEVQIYNLVSQGAALLAGAPDSPSMAVIGDAIFREIAAQLADPEASFDPTSAAAIETVLFNAVLRTGVVLNDEAAVLAGASQVIANGNQAVADIEFSADLEYLESVVRIQKVAQGYLASRLAEVANGTLAIQDVIDESSGTAFDARVAAAQIGNILPPELSISGMVLVEGDASDEFWFEFTVALDKPSAVPVSIDYQTADYSATEGEDYEEAHGTFTWAAGDSSSRLIRVKALGDSVFEANETFLVLLSKPVAAALFNDTGVGILVDNDPISVVVPEGSAVNELSLRLDGDLIELTNNGEVIWTERFAFALPLEIVGASWAENRLTVDLSGGSPIPVGGLKFIGGTGEDRLLVVGGVTTNLVNVPSTPGSGLLTVDGAEIEYASVEDVIRAPSIAAASFVVNEGGQIPLSAVVSTFANQDPTSLIYLWDLDGDQVFGEVGEDASHGDETAVSPVFTAGNLDGASTFPVTLEVTDSFGLSAAATFAIHLSNVNPTATLSSNGPTVYGQTATLSFANPHDDSAADTAAGFRYAYSLTGDFSGVTYASGSSTSASHGYSGLHAGSYTVYARIIDKDDGYTQYSQQITVEKADAILVVTGYTGVYDGAAHGASGSVTGVLGENLAGLDLGASFTNVPGGTANWTFTDVTGNYNDASGTAAIVITKADPTILVSGYTGGVYDGNDHTQMVTVSGVATDGPLYSTSLSGTNAGSYNQPWTYASSNYNAVSGTLAFDITKAPSTTTITIVGGPFTYTGLAQAPATVSVTGVGLNLTPAASYSDNVNAGTAAASYSYAGDANHEPSSDSQTFEIGKADATVIVSGYAGGVYDGNIHTQTVTVNGIAADGELYAASLSGTNAGNYSQAWSYLSGNYNFVDGTLAFAIDKASSATMVTIASGSFTYTGVAQTPATVSVTGIGGLSLTPTADYANNVNAGTATASYTFAGDANHYGSSDSRTFTIGQATAAVAVVNYSGVYDALPHTATVTITGLSGVVLASNSVTRIHAGHDAASATTSDPNYAPASGTATIDIAKADPTVAVSGFTGVYDGAAHAASGSATGVLGESLAGLDLGASFTNVPGGTANWTFTDATGNYKNASGTAAIVITKAHPTILASGYMGGAYDGSDHTQTVTVSGVPTDGQLYTASLTGTNAGSYNQPWSYASANYNDVSGTLAFNIAKAPSTTTVTISGGPFTYTGLAQTPATVSVLGAGGLSLTPAAVYSDNTDAGTATASHAYAGDANHEPSSDSETFAIGKATATVAVSGYTGGVYDGSTKTQTVTVNGVPVDGELYSTSLSGTNAGSYSLAWSFTSGNYHDVSGTLTFDIAKAPSITEVTIVGGPFTYSGLAQTPATVNVTGAGGLRLSPSVTYANNINAGTATATYSYAGDANYEPSSDSETFTIGQATAAVHVVNYSGVYDAQPHTASVTITGVGGMLLASNSVTRTNAGSDSATTTTSDPNYFAAAGNAAIHIVKAVAVVAVHGYTGVYDGSAHGATGTATGVDGVELSTGLNLGSSFTSVPGGTATWTFSGGNNYTDQSGSAAVAITKANPTIVVTGYTGGIYDGSDHTQTVTVSGVPTDGVLYSTSLSGTNASSYNQPWSYASANYNAMNGTLAFSIAKAPSTTMITIVGGPFSYTGQAQTPATVSVTGVGGLNLSPTAEYANNVNVGTATASYSYAGDANHEPSSDSQTFVIGSPSQAVLVRSNGTLEIFGTSGRDIVYVQRWLSTIYVHTIMGLPDHENAFTGLEYLTLLASQYEIHTFAASSIAAIFIDVGESCDFALVSPLIALPVTMHGRGGNDFLASGSGNDLILDESGNNVIFAGIGDDVVTTGGGNDRIWTDGGHDTISAGDGYNEVHAGGGDDVVTTGSGKDSIWGEDGNDVLQAGNGDNEIDAGEGNDLVVTGSGRDNIEGGEGNDLLRAGGGVDTVWGGSGHDIVLGGEGDDVLNGDDGRDIVVGGLGADRLTGNKDEDILIAGFTAFDSSDIALQAMMSEWASSRSYANRIKNLSGVSHSAFAARQNANYFLVGDNVAHQTVFDDGDVDRLTGSQGVDWFFANLDSGVKDTITDKASGETASDIDV